MPEWLPSALAALLLWGLWGFLPKLATNHIDAESAMVYGGAGSVLVTLLVLAMHGPALAHHPRGVAFAVLAGAAGSLGGLFYLYAVSRGTTQLVVTTTALYPLITILLSAAFLGEQVSARQGAGLTLALAAIALISG